VGYRSRLGRAGALVHMRTTLKRGVGRGATLNGNGRVAVPPSPLGSVTVYRQPPPPPRSGRSLAFQILGWAALVLAVLVGGTTGGAYLYLHESVAAVAPKTAEVKKALEKLDIALPGEPATALMIGYVTRRKRVNDQVFKYNRAALQRIG